MFDIFLLFSLGFLGSFGHCVGMCGPITVAFSLSRSPHLSKESALEWRSIQFHILLNLGRIVSYALVGAMIGALGSAVIAGGQVAGIGSGLRQGVSLLTGGLLIWLGLTQINPGIMPHVPLLHPLLKGKLHDRLTSGMVKLSMQYRFWTPLALGLLWSLVPCGFLYTAQIKAAATGNLWQGSATMLAFGLGTLPAMMLIGVFASRMSSDRRSQLFRLGGWITLTIGILTLARTGDTMADYTGHAALLCLVLALIARPISRFWSALLTYRRVIGVSAFILAIAHTLHTVEHSWGWNLKAIAFMLPRHQWSLLAGAIALTCLTPLALTSTNWAQKQLGSGWRSLHLLSVPALILSAYHCISIGSHYLGTFQPTWLNWTYTLCLIFVVLSVLLLRSVFPPSPH
jgi:uncharacterized protein